MLRIPFNPPEIETFLTVFERVINISDGMRYDAAAKGG
jgi:hypothetical protein